jgi:hypothetical protein
MIPSFMEETDMCLQATISAPATQSGRTCPARRLDPQQRQALAIEGLAGTPISRLAAEHDVSRKFVYQQVDKAEQALDEAFAPPAADGQVLFYIPVSKRWIKRLVLTLLLVCHASYRGVVEVLRDLFDYHLSPERVHAFAHEAAARVRALPPRALGGVRIGAHDEIFQKRQPVLVGVDTFSTYCYLLSLEERRDGITWGVRLLELQDQGFAPDAIIGDGGSALQLGQELALPGTARRGDVFHAEQETAALRGYLDNRAYDAITARSKLAHKLAVTERRRGRLTISLAQKLRQARLGEARAIALATDVTTLLQWLHYDLFALAGPRYEERRALYDFVVAELEALRPHCPHRIGPVCTYLTNHRDALLAFAKQLDRDLDNLASDFQVDPAVVRTLFRVQRLEPTDARRWPQEAALRQQLRSRFYELSAAASAVARHTVRASSVVENFNSRLRNYFFLRRSLGPDYLQLLQFFLNHRRFQRSEHPERVNKSPAELLTGQPHPHWLDMLGFTLTAESN